MPKKMTTEEFINKSIKIHGYVYDYSMVKYMNAKTKIIIICPIHGEFEQIPNSHLNGSGCPKCAIERRTNKKIMEAANLFIQKAMKIHRDMYDYSLVEYKDVHQKIIIICHIHGSFEQSPNNHLQGSGCPKCSRNVILTTKEFINKSIKIHGYVYDYSMVKYMNAKTKIIIICPIHGEFEQSPSNHLNGNGCPKCAIERRTNKKIMEAANLFIQKAMKIHGNTYDYSKVEYKKSNIKIIIICPIHGTFEQSPNNHLKGRGCPKCSRM